MCKTVGIIIKMPSVELLRIEFDHRFGPLMFMSIFFVVSLTNILFCGYVKNLPNQKLASTQFLHRFCDT